VHHNEDICVINADGSGVVRLTTGDAAEVHPACAPAGDRIAFQVTALGSSDTEIYILAADGSGPVNLTNYPGFDGQPDWQ
jgi:Tol biopolymer transport system component